MRVPTDGWLNGGWNNKRQQFYLLGETVGLEPNPSPEQLQDTLRRVSSAKVFAESIADFVEATGMTTKQVADRLKTVNHQLGVMDPLPFMSLKGHCDPKSFRGTAIWPAGTVAWMQLRWEQIQLAELAGATFERVIVLGSSRQCNAPADRRHPYVNGVFPEGKEPTELELMKQWVFASGRNTGQYLFPELDEHNEQGKPLSLEQMLRQYGERYEPFAPDSQVYVPANPNALYVPLHVRRVLGLDDVWLSQGGARLYSEMPPYWWPSCQDLMTTPSGIFRLWIELIRNGCINSR